MRAFIITVLVLLVASGASAWTLRGHVDPPGGSPLVLCSVSVSCAHHGSPARSCTQQNYAHRSLCQGDSQWEGVARYFASITEYRCSTDSSGPTTITNTPTARGAETDVEWCVTGNWVGGTCRSQVEPSNPARTAMYCDRTRPHTYSFETSEFWYRDDFTREASFQDTQHAWRIEAQQRDRGPPLQSYSSYTVVGTSSAGTTSFPRNVPISVGIGSCATTGSDRCEVRVRFSDYWLNDRILSNTYNIDRIAPESDAVVLRSVGGSADPHHTDSRGGWYRGGVALRVYSHDTVDTADQSGLKSIFVQWDQLASGCSSHGSGSYTGYPVSGPDATIHHSVTSDGVVHARFCYYAEDNARTGTSTVGNREAVKATSNDLFIDGQPPTTAISPSTTGAPGALSDGWTQNGDFDVTVTCDDGVGSGCDVIHYHSNRNTDAMTCPSAASYEGSWAVSGPIGSVSRQYTDTLCEDGNDCDFTFCAYSVDNVGNVGPVATMNYRIDRAPPQITGFEPTLENTRHADWYNRNLQMRATIRDDHGGGGSGFGGDASTCHVRRQGTTTPTVSMPCSGQGGDYTTTVTVGSGGVCPNQGACVLELVARDRVGNEATATYTVYIDTIDPNDASVTTIHTGDECNYLNTTTDIMYYGAGVNNPGACTTSDFDVRAAVSDPTPNSAGIWAIRWGSQGTNVEPNAPVITVSPDTSATWTHTKTYTTQQSGSGNDETITIGVEDRSYPGGWGSGNVRDPAGSFLVNYDSVPPVSQLDPEHTVWVGDSFTFSITATDDKVPVRRFWYSFESDATSVAPEECSGDRSGMSPIGTSVSGSFDCDDGDVCMARLCWAAEDEVSNIEDVQGHLYGIDRSPPTVHPFLYRPSPRYPFAAQNTLDDAIDNWFNETFEIEVLITDVASGVDRCEYRINRDDDDWLDAGCRPADINLEGSSGLPDWDHVDDDREQTVTLQIPVGASASGPAGACTSEGRDVCRIDVRAFDGVGNPSEIRSETVSIDWTPPRCELVRFEEGDPDINQFYNPDTGVFYYNPASDGNYTLHLYFNDQNGLNGDDVSGIYRTVFPTLTGSPHVFEENLSMLPEHSGVTNHPDYSRSLMYTYNVLSGYSSLDSEPAVVLVQDQAGNVGTCTVEVIRDTEPPELDDQIVRFDHVNLELPYNHGYDPNLYLELSAVDHAASVGDEEGAGIRNAELRLFSVDSIVVNDFPRCLDFDYDTITDPTDSSIYPLIGTSEDGWLGGDYDLSSNLTQQANFFNALSSGEGRCFQVFGVFYDRVDNRVIVPPHYDSPPEHRYKVIAVDDSEGPEPENACSFFGTYDNCNNRSAHLNGLAVDQFLTRSCPGSCLHGRVSLQTDTGTDEYYENSRVELPGFGKPHYNVLSGSGGRYRIFNISDAIDLTPRRDGLVYDFVANPRAEHQHLYNARSVDLTIDQRIGEWDDPASYPPIHHRDVIIGFRSTLCTPACTLSTDPVPGTCRIDCAGYGGCPDTGPEYDALVACQGLSRGFIRSADDGSRVYQCCTSEIDPSDIQPLSAAFEVDAENVARSERLVMLGNKLVKLVVITFD